MVGLEMTGFGAFTPAGAAYEAEAEALFARFSVDPGGPRKSAINACIASLKTAGVWAKLDALYIMAAHNSQAALLNWIANANNLTVTGTPIFTTDNGYIGDASIGTWLENTVNINALTHFQQDDAHISLWCRTDSVDVHAVMQVKSGGNVMLWPRYDYSGGILYSRVNDNSGEIPASPSSIGHFLANRTSSTDRQVYKNGSSAGTLSSTASSARSANPLQFLYENGTQELAVASIGAGLSPTEVSDFYAALNTLKTAIGW